MYVEGIEDSCARPHHGVLSLIFHQAQGNLDFCILDGFSFANAKPYPSNLPLSQRFIYQTYLEALKQHHCVEWRQRKAKLIMRKRCMRAKGGLSATLSVVYCYCEYVFYVNFCVAVYVTIWHVARVARVAAKV